MGSSYIFFDADLRDRFIQMLSARGLACSTQADTMEGFVVELTADPDDATLEAIETDYETLQQEQMLRAEERADWVTHQTAGITITRPDGSTAVVRLPPEIARPLLEHFTAEQAHDLVQAIAHSLEHPLDGPLCRKASRP